MDQLLFSHWTHESFALTLNRKDYRQGEWKKEMETTTHTTGRGLATILRDTRQARAARRALQHELSSYTTPSELNDLEAILDRHSDEDTADIRRFLVSRRVA
jgi:hypothetical protein